MVIHDQICKFCGQKKRLINAHIIPQRFFTHEKKPLVTVRREIPYLSRCPIGFYDNNILCLDCDGAFGVFDQEAQELFLSDMEGYKRDGIAYVIPKDAFNYDRLKLFFVSLLWRASVSSRDEFKQVNLGNEFEQLALNLLKNPGLDSEDIFPVFIFKLKEVDNIGIRGIYIDPIPYLLGAVNMYRFVFAGFSINIRADHRPLPRTLPLLCMKPGKDLLIIEKSPLEEIEHINNISASRKTEDANKFTERTGGIITKIKEEDGRIYSEP